MRLLRASVPGFPRSYRLRDAIELPIDAVHGLTSGLGPMANYFPPSNRVFIVRHGFIEQIALNQRAFIRCAKGLFQNHPVRDVFIMMQDPAWPAWIGRFYRSDRPGRFAWMRFKTGNDLRIGSFPGIAFVEPIWDRLGRETEVLTETRQLIAYDGRMDAYLDLSAACLRYGRDLAGLPALEKDGEVGMGLGRVAHSA